MVAAAQPAPPPTTPVTVAALLRELSATGVDVLYSSDLVPANLEAPPSQQGLDAMARAIEALAAHGLTLRNTGPRSYVVTQTARPRAPAPSSSTAAMNAAAAEDSLSDVAVFASRYSFSATASGKPIEVARADIQRAPGAADDPLRALQSAPGLATNLSARPYVRGALLDDVLVRFDGIPLANPFHFSSFHDLISVFDPAAVDRVDVYTGGFPVEYGTRSGGVIDVAPRSLASGSEYRIGLSRISADLSTVGHAEEWPIDWLLTARDSTDGAILRPVGTTSGVPTFYDVTGRLRWRASATSAWTLGWLVVDDQVHVGKGSGDEIALVRFNDLYTWIAWEWSPLGALHGRTTISTTSADQDRQGTLNLTGIANGSLAERRDTSGWEFRTTWRYMPSAAWTVTMGAEAGIERAQLGFVRSEFLSATLAASFDRPADASFSSSTSPRQTDQSVFASLRWRGPGCEAEIGGRIDRQDYRGLGVQAQASPRINVRCDPTEAWHAYGSWGEFTQAQRVGEWRSEDGQTVPDSATRATHGILGTEYESIGTIRWRLEAYRNHWTSVSPYFDNSLNSVSLAPELEPDRVRIAPTAATAAGAELSARRSFGPEFDSWGAYTLSRTRDDLTGVDVPRSWDQTDALTLGLAWRHAETSASVLANWHSGWPRTPFTVMPATAAGPAYLLVGARNSRRWGSFFSVDARVSQAIPLADGELTLWLDVTNLTNRGNECCSRLGSGEPTANLPLTASSPWAPRIVNVGVTWRVKRN